MRSPIAAIRSRARHRGKAPGQLRAEQRLAIYEPNTKEVA